jgi:hypothetical protein
VDIRVTRACDVPFCVYEPSRRGIASSQLPYTQPLRVVWIPRTIIVWIPRTIKVSHYGEANHFLCHQKSAACDWSRSDYHQATCALSTK